ncbi:MAG: hypothetical protein HYT48_02160 [Candidatus Vogelbacteria bacterium]|nr:hypothetical protein [Candidatus Vogelbacteria bacterium]
MTLNRRSEYEDNAVGQAAKSLSLDKASIFVKEIIKVISPKLKECVYFESEKTIGKAPAMKLPSGKLVVAPDIRCATFSDKVFWIEAKDKSQRFFKPDTGADLFQVYGWYQIWKFLNEPVFVVFKDPEYEQCLPRMEVSAELEHKFRTRWEMFKGLPYGGWLSQILNEDRGYPQIFVERTREMPMYIFYFLIHNMVNKVNWDEVINDVENNRIPPLQKELRAFFEGRLVGQEQIESMIDDIFSGEVERKNKL